MQISNINIKNFRGFEGFSAKFDNNMNVIIGNNGSGKTALLDAIAIAASSLFRGIDSIQALNIKQDDVRLKTFDLGGIVNSEPQFPTKISANGYIASKIIQWSHSLNGRSAKTTVREAKEIINIGKLMQENVRQGDIQTVLPIVSYYGTGRLWAIKKEKRDDVLSKSLSRFAGYLDCMDSKFSQKLMLAWLRKMALLEYKEGVAIPAFTAVKHAMEHAFSETKQYKSGKIFFDIKNEELTVEYETRDGEIEILPFRLLSDGYRNTISMIGDIAYRMSVLNPQLEEKVIEETSGIVLIDEVDMFLHPKWQTAIIDSLIGIFPKIQFFVTTHAPSVIQTVRTNNIMLLDYNEKRDVAINTFGKDANDILKYIMQIDERPFFVKDKINKIYGLIDNSEICEAKIKLAELKTMLGDDSAITELKTALAFEALTLED